MELLRLHTKKAKEASLDSLIKFGSIQKGGGGGISHPKGQISHPKNPQNKKFIIMILTQLYNLQSDLPVPLFKNVKDFIKIDST